MTVSVSPGWAAKAGIDERNTIAAVRQAVTMIRNVFFSVKMVPIKNSFFFDNRSQIPSDIHLGQQIICLFRYYNRFCFKRLFLSNRSSIFLTFIQLYPALRRSETA